mgnify:CR=1 FL=1
MTEKEAQAKHLDLGKAQMAMSSLGGAAADAADGIAVSAADVQVICDELEVTEEVATKVLRRVAAAGIVPSTEDHDVWVAAALRHLITESP